VFLGECSACGVSSDYGQGELLSLCAEDHRRKLKELSRGESTRELSSGVNEWVCNSGRGYNGEDK
jgi:hypothetical protein